MRQFEATISINREISPSWKALGLVWPADRGEPKPGQFFTFRATSIVPGDEGLLRRPLAFAGFEDGLAYALYQIRGSGTKALSAMGEGSRLDVIGPLGNSFPLPGDDESPCLLGGGIGIGPLLFLYSTIAKMRRPLELGARLFLGFRSSSLIPEFGAAQKSLPLSYPKSGDGLETLSESLAHANIATDDGTEGYAGTVLDALAAKGSGQASLERYPRHYYGCGPAPMLAALDTLAGAEGAAAHLSVEQWMACGVGACYGCVLPATKGGYLRACADGPIFQAGEIRWKE